MKFTKMLAGMTAVLLMGVNWSMIPVSAADSYRDVLYSVWNYQSYDDIQFEIMEEVTNIENNGFAICDVDGDGIKELLINWDDTYVSAQKEVVFSKDANGNVFCKGELPLSNTYYDNGIVKSYWAHNQTPSDIWPYSLMQYNPSTQKYELIATVMAWDKSIESTYEGKTFPDWADTSGTGRVYYVTPAESFQNNLATYYDTEPIDSGNFQSWLGQYTNSSSGWMTPHYWYLTSGSIDYVCELQETNNTTAVSGDHNHDGIVDATDAAYILQYSAEVGAGNFMGTLDEYMQNFIPNPVVPPTEIVDPPVVAPTEVVESPSITGYIKVVYPEDLGIVGDGCTFYFVATGGNYDYYSIWYSERIYGEDKFSVNEITSQQSECEITAGSIIESVTAYVTPYYHDGTAGETITCTGRSKYY